jgi:uncharacterized protein (UPF0264 family)
MLNLQSVKGPTPKLDRTAGCRLLVSVRDRDEAIAAIDGGCDILDVKEPDRGSLGMADLTAMKSANEAARSRSIATSVAFGELTDWIDRIAIPKLPDEIDFVKLGLSRARSINNWKDRYGEVRRRFDQVAKRALKWITVIYADDKLADSPEASELVDVAVEADCAGMLIDTYQKNGTSLLDYWSPDELNAIAIRARRAGLSIAVAGSLRLNSLPALVGIPFDVIAVRTVVCRNGVRRGSVESSLVRKFKSAMIESLVSAAGAETQNCA